MTATPLSGVSAGQDSLTAAPVEAVERVVIPVLEERLTVGKRVVETGHAVRLRKRVIGHAVQVDLPLERQSVVVRRVSLDRPVDVAPEIRHEGDMMVVPVVEERLVWRKQLVLVEELYVKRESHLVRAPEEVILQREEIVIERLDPLTGVWKEDASPSSGAA